MQNEDRSYGRVLVFGQVHRRRLLERGEEIITLTGHPNRPDPFEGKVKAYPLNFSNETELAASLGGVHTLYNTYWVRFDRGENTQPRAVENTRKLVKAAVKAGVERIVHISITNPSSDSHLPYFWGKAANERAVIESGLSHAILRPTVLFGAEDILINNIAWLLRRFPFFAIPGDGSYRLQPVFVDDLAKLAVDVGYTQDNVVWDAVGPDIFNFRGTGSFNRQNARTQPELASRSPKAGPGCGPIPEHLPRRCTADSRRSGRFDGRAAGFQGAAALQYPADRLAERQQKKRRGKLRF